MPASRGPEVQEWTGEAGLRVVPGREHGGVAHEGPEGLGPKDRDDMTLPSDPLPIRVAGFPTPIRTRRNKATPGARPARSPDPKATRGSPPTHGRAAGAASGHSRSARRPPRDAAEVPAIEDLVIRVPREPVPSDDVPPEEWTHVVVSRWKLGCGAPRIGADRELLVEDGPTCPGCAGHLAEREARARAVAEHMKGFESKGEW